MINNPNALTFVMKTVIQAGHRSLFIPLILVLTACNSIDLPVDDLENELVITETSGGGAVFNYKWGVDQISWSYQPSDDYAEFMPDILFALDTWQDHTSDFSFNYLGEKEEAANLYFVDVLSEAGIFQAKQQQACGFLDPNTKMRAFSCLAEDIPGRDLQAGDQITIFIASNTKGREPKFVLAHETGHALGLGHTVTCEFDNTPIMYAGSNPCGVPSGNYEIHASDIEALHTHYQN